MQYLKDNPIIAKDLENLLNADPVLSAYNLEQDKILWPCFDAGVEGLIHILIGQQISFKAADALWLKLKEACEGMPLIDFLKIQSIDALKSFGFSRQKQNYLSALITALDDGFNINKLSEKSEDEILKEITSLKGFGLWSAHIYLIFCLQRRNILPDNDLVIDKALQNIFTLKMRPDRATCIKLSKPWEGRKTAATLILWHLQIYHFQ